MRYVVSINMANAAFEESAGVELARILRELADRVEGGGPVERNLRDTNGNTVGSARVEE